MKTIETDVLVCGAGCAGIAAAISAARNGAKTLVVERAGFTGGIITAVGLPYLDGLVELKTGRVVVKGIASEITSALGINKSAKPSTINDYVDKTVDKRWMTIRIPNVEYYKKVADDLLEKHKSNLKILYHTMVADAEVKGDRISQVILANKDGLVKVNAKQVIDCTGDADVARFAGCPVNKTAPLMPLTLHFRIGNVVQKKGMDEAAKDALMREFQAGSLPMFYGPGIMFAFGDNEVYIHAIRVPGDASDAADLTRAEIQARRDSWTIFEAWKKSVPGFENSYYLSSAPFTGVRETYRIDGEYTITGNDLAQSKSFDDAIATGCWYLDRHPNKQTIHPNGDGTLSETKIVEKLTPNAYDIPYRSLIPKTVSNLLVAGRCHSADAEASSSTRVTITAMALGEAAGCAAAMATKSNGEVGLLSGVKVREKLVQQNAGPFTHA